MSNLEQLKKVQVDCYDAYTALEVAEAEVDRANAAYNRVVDLLDKEEEAHR